MAFIILGFLPIFALITNLKYKSLAKFILRFSWFLTSILTLSLYIINKVTLILCIVFMPLSLVLNDVCNVL